MDKNSNPFPGGSKWNPHQVLPDFEIYLKDGSDYIKLQMCNELGIPTQGSQQASSALVPLKEKDLYIKLPDHRVFLSLTRNKQFVPVNGMVQLPTIGNYFSSKKNYLKTNSIIEIDKHYVGGNSHYRWKQDINHQLVAPATYLFVGQLVLWRGASVTTVGYMTHRAIGPILRKIGNLSPILASADQAYMEAITSSSQASNVGQTVLKTASSITYDNAFLVDRYIKR